MISLGLSLVVLAMWDLYHQYGWEVLKNTIEVWIGEVR